MSAVHRCAGCHHDYERDAGEIVRCLDELNNVVGNELRAEEATARR